MNPSILIPAMDRIVGQTGLFILAMITSLGEGKLNSNQTLRWMGSAYSYPRSPAK